MKEDKFSETIKKDSTDPMVRFYKDIKIRIVAEKHHFEVK